MGLGREKAPKETKYRGAGAAEQAKKEADYERFLQDLEEDEEMRQGGESYSYYHRWEWLLMRVRS